MPFIQQQNDTMCGAYALAYWKWMCFSKRNLSAPPQDNDINYVKSIYGIVKFGGNAPVPSLAEDADPINMMYWYENIMPDSSVSFYTGDNETIKKLIGLISAVGAPQKVLYDELNNLGQIISSTITLMNGQYAIMLYSHTPKAQLAAANAGGNAQAVPADAKPEVNMDPSPAIATPAATTSPSLHYMLTYRLNGTFYILNSWDGYEKQITEAQFNGTVPIDYPNDILKSIQAGILLG
ncbi:hypothetical protein [Anaeromicropila populeti]|uniref:Uncharacterized protein n=1 Tax=Anaeromicropila populeti TaxID=37658 RepID=A0A1I6IMT9_9FIRM|nr:hypothetical protein [Anaeromicropila populeti]SFR68036.1 hypothetical protein SAMN05661086_00918 [Anaeromicropila populeti]